MSETGKSSRTIEVDFEEFLRWTHFVDFEEVFRNSGSGNRFGRGFVREENAQAITMDEASILAIKLIKLAGSSEQSSAVLRDRALFKRVAGEAIRCHHSDTAPDGGSTARLQEVLRIRNRIKILKGW